MKYWRLSIFALAFTACDSGKPFVVTNSLEKDALAGKWYEVATIGSSFPCNCPTYDFTADGENIMQYSCFEEENRVSTVHTGLLELSDRNQQVNFNFRNLPDKKYLVLDTDARQSYILLGSEDRLKLKILSRTTNPAASTIKKFLNKAEELNFDTSGLNYHKHNCR